MDNTKTTEVLEIASLAIAANQARRITDDSSPYAVVPAGYGIECMEYTLPAPARKRGKVFLGDAVSFIAFFNKHKTSQSMLYGATAKPAFKGIINDDGDAPGWKDHQVIYQCPHSQEWGVWKSGSGRHMNQTEFAEFIEDNLPDIYSTTIEEPSAAELLEIASNFKMNKKVNFSSGKRLDNGQICLEYVEDIQGSAGAKGQIRIPEKFWIAVPVFENGSPYKVECRFKYRVKEGVLTMWFEMVRAHKVLESAFKDVWQEIKEGCEQDILRGFPD